MRERENPAPSTEEKDEIIRSRKKVRAGIGEFSNTQALVPRVEAWMQNEGGDLDRVNEVAAGGSGESGARWKTYKQAFTKETDDNEEEEDWWSGDRWKERISVNMTERGLDVIIPPKEKERLAKRWSNTLIVKLLGHMVAADYLEKKIQQLWGHQGEVEIIDIGSGFFAVKFSNKADYDLALTGGPWLIYDHYLAVQPWKEDFDPDEEEISKIAAWVRVRKLPLDYYDKGILHVLGSQIGRVLKVDMNTLRRSKGRFARLCVELDLKSALRPVIFINGKEKKIEYEGINLICFNCGRYGHSSDHCLEKQEGSSSKGIQPGGNSGGNATKVSEQVNEAGGGVRVNPKTVEGQMATGTTAMNFGSWMVVQSPRRNRWAGYTERRSNDPRRDFRGKSSHEGQGSRYAALNLEEENMQGSGSKETAVRTPLNDITNSVRSLERAPKMKFKNNGPNHESGPVQCQIGQSSMGDLMRAKEKLGLSHQADRTNSYITGREGGKGHSKKQAQLLTHLSSQPPEEGEISANASDMSADDDPIDPGSTAIRDLQVYPNPLSEGVDDADMSELDAPVVVRH